MEDLLKGRGPCLLCPRACGAQRGPHGGNGWCGMGSRAVVARAARHDWEEPCISGLRGTGAVFFSGCTLKCCYCQNWEISHEGRERELSPRELADLFKRLEDQGVHSISLVTATHFLPAILDAFELYKPSLPIVYNTSGYERAEVIAKLAGLVDIWLPDIKLVSSSLSRLLLNCPDYFAFAAPAVKAMCRASGPARYDSQGMMRRGTLLRHLVIPGCVTDTLKVLRFAAEELPPGTPMSLMRQYTPIPQCTLPGLDRKLRADEYARALEAFHALELTGYAQEDGSSDPAYTPPFDGTGVTQSGTQPVDSPAALLYNAVQGE